MALAPVPDPEVTEAAATPRQLPLFESQRPSRFQLSISGNIDLSLAMEDEAELATAMKLNRPFLVTIASEKEPDEGITFFARVTKRTHKTVRHAEQGDAIVSAATLSVTGLAAEE